MNEEVISGEKIMNSSKAARLAPNDADSVLFPAAALDKETLDKARAAL